MSERPQAAIFDVDGTICDVTSIRHLVFPTHPDFPRKKGMDRFHADSVDCPPHAHVIEMMREQKELGRDNFVVTARMYRWRYHTMIYLWENGAPYDYLMMRRDGDTRSDRVVKEEILRRIQATHDVVLAVDDNPSVIALWQEHGINTVVVLGWYEVPAG